MSRANFVRLIQILPTKFSKWVLNDEHPFYQVIQLIENYSFTVLQASQCLSIFAIALNFTTLLEYDDLANFFANMSLPSLFEVVLIISN